MSTTHTYTVLEVSEAAFKEIKESLEGAGYGNTFFRNHEERLLIPMEGLCLAQEYPKLPPKAQEVDKAPIDTKKEPPSLRMVEEEEMAGWFYLEPGDTVCIGDMIWNQKEWAPCGASIGNKVSPQQSRLYCRKVQPGPVRIATSVEGGWRYLNAGETTIEGDEWWHGGDEWWNGTGWEPCAAGLVVCQPSEAYSYRRRIIHTT